jgi:hypothetical protein
VVPNCLLQPFGGGLRSISRQGRHVYIEGTLSTKLKPYRIPHLPCRSRS